MNNSWGCPTSEGCTTRGELETIVNNTQAAGIFVEASAGNSGPGCSSVSDPPAIYEASFSTGAIRYNQHVGQLQQPRTEHLLHAQHTQAEYFRTGGKRALVLEQQRH